MPSFLIDKESMEIDFVDEKTMENMFYYLALNQGWLIFSVEKKISEGKYSIQQSEFSSFFETAHDAHSSSLQSRWCVV